MTSDLRELWPGLQTGLEKIADQLRLGCPGLWAAPAYMSNDVFPFRAHLSLMSGDPRVDEEDVVFSVSFKADGHLILFSSDIAAGDGEILLDGPVDQFDTIDTERDLLDWGGECVTEALSFARRNIRILEDALR